MDAINGSLLVDGDLAIVTYGGRAYLYELDHDNSSAEASPFIISPDKNYGTKRWVWQPAEFGNATLARAYLTANQSINNNTSTYVSGYTEVFDIGGNFASDKYTAPVTGYYHVDFGIAFLDAESKLSLTVSYLVLNGTVINEGNLWRGTDQYSIYSRGSGIHYMTAAQYLQLAGVMYTTDASAAVMYAGDKYTYISVYLISKG